jgi:hypothetical protein
VLTPHENEATEILQEEKKEHFQSLTGLFLSFSLFLPLMSLCNYSSFELHEEQKQNEQQHFKKYEKIQELL